MFNKQQKNKLETACRNDFRALSNFCYCKTWGFESFCPCKTMSFTVHGLFFISSQRKADSIIISELPSTIMCMGNCYWLCYDTM